jgi:hypothetical protein
MVMTAAFGIASRRIVGAIGCSSSMRVRASTFALCRFALLFWQPSMMRAGFAESSVRASRASKPARLEP